MIILGMDTSSVNATVAVMNDKKLVAEYIISNDRTHSVIIMPLLEDMLKKSGLTLNDVDVFASAIGPGSFTGLRIGIASVKTLAQAKGKPVVGINSLESLSANFDLCTDAIICPIIDARHKQVYTALYENSSEICPPKVEELDQLLSELEKSGKKVIFCGDGVLAYGEYIESKNNPLWCVAPQHLSMQKASSLCYAAYKRAQKGDFDNLYTLAPLYLRRSQAERELDAKRQVEAASNS